MLTNLSAVMHVVTLTKCLMIVFTSSDVLSLFLQVFITC